MNGSARRGVVWLPCRAVCLYARCLFQMQYSFIYQALLEYYLYGDTELDVSSLEKHLQTSQSAAPNLVKIGLEEEFKVSMNGLCSKIFKCWNTQDKKILQKQEKGNRERKGLSRLDHPFYSVSIGNGSCGISEGGLALTSCSENAHSNLHHLMDIFLYAFGLLIEEKWNYSFSLVLDARSDSAGKWSWVTLTDWHVNRNVNSVTTLTAEWIMESFQLSCWISTTTRREKYI